MKFDKQLAIILVLISMLLSAVAVAVYLYNQNKKIEKNKTSLVAIYVAKTDIKKEQQITEKDLKRTTIQRQYLLNKPLLKKEIIGKFAKEPIYKNEAFLKKKLLSKLDEETSEKKEITFKYNSYNMSLKLFENPNYSLEPGDIINIISVYPSDPKEGKTNNYKVQYIAKNVQVLGFLRDGRTTKKSIVKTKIKRLVKKKQVEEEIEIKADEIVLDIKQKTILALIKDYNKNKQLWMVKSKLGEEIEEKPVKKVVKKKPKKRTYKKYTKKRTKTYPVTWYSPKDTVKTKTATISYTSGEKKAEKKEVKISTNYKQKCSQTNRLLIGTTNSFSLKTHPSFRAKTHKVIKKNYVLPYTNISKINNDWYMVCDGSYVNKKDVRAITFEEYSKLK